ncbi:MAG TPA: type I glutamate--ammonia ligase [Fibrobacteres bacterium]|jgi:glutamine synthetase|nr:type I glutamate--ammonia ligase [Fibrobacterota bacterium]
MTPNDVIKMAKDEKVEFVDLMYGDMFGILQHFSYPVYRLDESMFKDGIAFDGSSIRGWKSIDKSDMLMMPDPNSAFIDPFRAHKTLNLFCDILEPRTGELYDRDPRSIAKKALAYLKASGIGDTAYFGPEPEFFVFDGLRYESKPNIGFYELITNEGPWTSGDEGSLGHKMHHKFGYAPAAPLDTMSDLRDEMVLNLMKMGITPEIHHHEVATAQCEIGTKFDQLIPAGDQVHKLKYAVKNTAAKYGKTATFMPKPLWGDNGSGMHVHTSIWKDGKNLFAGDGYANMSKMAIWAIGGILKHGRAIQVFSNSSVNSYRRLVPGYEAPVNLAYSATNRSASIRIPYVQGDKARRFEFRCPDSSGSPYLTFAAMLMAMIDGIKNQIDPGQPLDKNIYELPPEELKKVPSTCYSLEQAVEELEKDKAWLTAGDVFSEDFMDTYVDIKKTAEIAPVKLRPNPVEFELYYQN